MPGLLAPWLPEGGVPSLDVPSLELWLTATAAAPTATAGTAGPSTSSKAPDAAAGQADAPSTSGVQGGSTSGGDKGEAGKGSKGRPKRGAANASGAVQAAGSGASAPPSPVLAHCGARGVAALQFVHRQIQQGSSAGSTGGSGGTGAGNVWVGNNHPNNEPIAVTDPTLLVKERGGQHLKVFNRAIAQKLADPASLSQYASIFDMLVSGC